MSVQSQHDKNKKHTPHYPIQPTNPGLIIVGHLLRTRDTRLVTSRTFSIQCTAAELFPKNLRQAHKSKTFMAIMHGLAAITNGACPNNNTGKAPKLNISVMN